MVQFLPGRGFGQGFTETFPLALQDAMSKYQEKKSKGELLKQQYSAQTERDRQKILLQEAAKERQMEKFSKLLGLSPPQLDELQDLNSGLNPPLIDTLDIDSTEDQTGIHQGRNISDDQILGISLMNPQIGKLLQDQKQAAINREEKFQERGYKRNEKYLDRLDEAAYNFPKLDLSINQMQSALDAGDFESFRNIAGDITGLEFLKNSSAQVVNSSMKEFLQGALSDITGRPNQWLEQQISRALINPQYSNKANRLILDGLKGVHLLRKKEKEISDELEEKFLNKEKELPRNFQKLVREKLEPYSKSFEDEYRTKLKNLNKEIDKSEKITEKVAPGTKLTEDVYRKIYSKERNREKALKVAKDLGYEF